jgi:hypothetical protein
VGDRDKDEDEQGGSGRGVREYEFVQVKMYGGFVKMPMRRLFRDGWSIFFLYFLP